MSKKLLLLVSVLWLPAPGGAQPTAPTVRPEAAIASAEATALRVEQELVCLQRVHAQLLAALELMREARAQLSMAQTSAARRDAIEAIRALEQRIIRLEREAIACRSRPSERAASSDPPEGVVYQDAPPDPAADSVARPNPATRVVERNENLARNLRVVVAEQVDGRGVADHGAVRAAVRAVAPRVSRCYERLVGRGALRRGQIILSFTITRAGTIRRVVTEGDTFRNPAFARCVQSAGAAMGSTTPAQGGEATFSYTLAFP